MIKAVVFDFDGTIIDTETAWYVAFRDAYKEHDVELTLELYSQCIGTSLHSFNPYEYLMTELGLQIDKEAFRKSIQERHTKLMEAEKVRPGVMEYLEAAKEAGLRIGLASSSHQAWIDKHLDLLGLRSYFECIRTADHVKKVKPDPELYVQAMECLGAKPSETIAIEDSPNGAAAALAAGMHVVVAPNAITKTLSFQPVHHRANLLSEIDFKQILSNPVGQLYQAID